MLCFSFVLCQTCQTPFAYADCSTQFCDTDAEMHAFKALSLNEKFEKLDSVYSTAIDAKSAEVLENAIRYFDRAAVIIKEDHPGEDWMVTKCQNLGRNSVIEILFAVDKTPADRLTTFLRLKDEDGRKQVHERYQFVHLPTVIDLRDLASWAETWYVFEPYFDSEDGRNFARARSDEARSTVFERDPKHEVLPLSEFTKFFSPGRQEDFINGIYNSIRGSNLTILYEIEKDFIELQIIIGKMPSDRRELLEPKMGFFGDALALEISTLLEFKDLKSWLHMFSLFQNGGSYFGAMIDVETRFYNTTDGSTASFQFLYDMTRFEANRLSFAKDDSNQWFYSKRKMEDINDSVSISISVNSGTELDQAFSFFMNLYNGYDRFLDQVRQKAYEQFKSDENVNAFVRQVMLFSLVSEKLHQLKDSNQLPPHPAIDVVSNADSSKTSMILFAFSTWDLNGNWVGQLAGVLRTKNEWNYIAYSLASTWKTYKSVKDLTSTLVFLDLAIERAKLVPVPKRLNQALTQFSLLESKLVLSFLKSVNFDLGTVFKYYPKLYDDSARSEVLDTLGVQFLAAKTFRIMTAYQFVIESMISSEYQRDKAGLSIPWPSVQRSMALISTLSSRSTLFRQRIFKVDSGQPGFSQLSILNAQDAGQGLLISLFGEDSISPSLRLPASDFDGLRNQYHWMGKMNSGQPYEITFRRSFEKYPFESGFGMDVVSNLNIDDLMKEKIIGTVRTALHPEGITFTAISQPVDLDLIPLLKLENAWKTDVDFLMSDSLKAWRGSSQSIKLKSIPSDDFQAQPLDLVVQLQKPSKLDEPMIAYSKIRTGNESFAYRGTFDEEYGRISLMRTDEFGAIFKIEGRLLRDGSRVLFKGYSYSESGRNSAWLEFEATRP